MLSDRIKDALDGIRINIDAIRSFLEGNTIDDFLSDRRTFYAVTRALEIISEASRRLPEDFIARYPEVQWRAVRDAGNIYRHKYDKVSPALVWDTASRQLDSLWDVVCQEAIADQVDQREKAASDNDRANEISRR